ncbi:MAG TPA: TIGR00341 family protein [Thermoleophilia bacterium]|nr:TIGR00341 family protein [Thermoleophilia bacterium]
MGWLARAIDAGRDYRNPLVEVADGLFVDVGNTKAKLSQFWMLLGLSSAIAAGGVVSDSTPAVIGAMIVAPLATPIYGVALATSIGDAKRLRSAFLLLTAGIAANIAIGILMGYLASHRMPLDANPQIIGRTAPTLLDLIVAVATGVAGAFALTRRDVSNILAGVAIAISLVPVLAVVGITLGAGRFDLAWGALVLFLTNVAAILIAGTVVFAAAGYQKEAAVHDSRVTKRARRVIVVFVIALLIPLTAASVRTARYENWVLSATAATEAWVEGSAWTLDSVRVEGSDIVITALGPGDPPPPEELRDKLRRDVPEAVPVRLIEESGRVTDL